MVGSIRSVSAETGSTETVRPDPARPHAAPSSPVSNGATNGAGHRALGDRYELLGLIGVGSSAEVYRARDTSLGREVAVKVLHAGLAADGPFRRRFESEARHAASLGHPNVLSIFDWSDGAETYLVTELLAGGSLRHLLDQGSRLSPSQALLVGLQAGRGLSHAHTEGFVHRDIKPANLMFAADGRVSIADFGIARAVAESSWTEPSGALVGTARYAAPEQALGRGVDGRADVYALALTLIEAVTGEVPLVADSPLATMVLRQDRDVEVPEAMGPLVPALTAAGLADPTERATASELIADLERAAALLPRPEPLPLAGLPPSSGGALLGDDRVIDITDAAPADVATVADPTTAEVVAEPVVAGDRTAGADAGGDRSGHRGRIDVPPDTARGRRRWPWVVLVIVVVLAGVAGALLLTDTVDTPLVEAEPEIITFPVGTYVGRDLAEVEREAESNGWLLTVTTTRSDGSVVGEVLTQSPDPGVQLEEGATVVLVVSEGVLLHLTPELVGLARDDAETALLAEDLVVGSIERVFDEEVAEGIVIAASAPAGIEVETGTVVDLTLSAGPEPRAVPDLTGRTRAEAEAALAELGLVAVVTDDFSQTVAEGLVIASDPALDATVERGAEVVIVISKGLPFVTVPDVLGLSAV